MQLCGYGALPNGEELIAREQQREKDRAGFRALRGTFPDFTFFVSRDFSDDHVEVVIEVLHYHPPGNNKSLDHRDPAYDAGEVTFGNARYLNGESAKLTELELNAAEQAFWNQ